jgi:hypothetical protein
MAHGRQTLIAGRRGRACSDERGDTGSDQSVAVPSSSGVQSTV